MADDLRYWLQGRGTQNFGDFLSAYFLRYLFLPLPSSGRDLRLVGSCIDDWFVEPPPQLPDGGPLEGAGPIFWGCGLRTENGLSPERRSAAEILAVRGPLTRSALRLGNTVPIGDPGLLLPALHPGDIPRRRTGATLLIPHFHDGRGDADLIAATGCSAALRPNVPNDLTAVGEFIDHIVASEFVLCGSLHAAVVAAAYGRPFAFWDSGDIDLPFKWQDFAASIAIPCEFQPNLAAAQAHYEAEIAPSVRIPVLWPLLVAAPLPVRPDAFIKVVEMDIARHGLVALDAGVSSRGASRLRDRLEDIAAAAKAAEQLAAKLAAQAEHEQQLRERVAALTAVGERLSTELAELAAQEEERRREEFVRLERLETQHTEAVQREMRLQAERDTLQAALHDHDLARAQLAKLHGEVGQLNGEVARLRAREAWLAGEEARLHEAVQARDFALAAARADVAARAARLDSILRSPMWRAMAPLRALGRRVPWVHSALRRLRRLGWSILTMQVRRQLEARRRIRDQVALLRESPLFDAAYYLAQHPDLAPGTDAVRHYVFAGAALGYAPNPLFDGRWYTASYMQTVATGLTPLAHYVAEGATRGNDPHPLFETAWYAAQNPDAGQGGAALLHYLRVGAVAGVPPNRLFHPSGYLSQYRDARESGLDALQHFIRIGAAKGHHPHPLFDTAWYVATYPEVAASGMNPLAYYLRVGAGRGHDCTPLQRRIAGLRPDRPLAMATRDDPEASIVIPVYGNCFDTLRCLHTVAAHSGDWVGYEVIVLDDDPANPVASCLTDIPGLRVVANAENLGFLRNCNQARTLARGWHIVFLNNDTLVGPDWLDPLLRLVRKDPTVGMVGCKLLNADGTVQEAGGAIFRDGWGYPVGHGDDPRQPEYNYVREVDVVVGAAFLVRRDVFQSLGGFDERYAPAFYEEFDLAFAVRKAGFKVLYQPRSEVTHLRGTSYSADTRDRQSAENHARFCVKWAAELETRYEADAGPFLARQAPGDVGTILMIDDKVPEYDRHAGGLTIFQYIKLLRNLGLRVVFCPADLIARQPYTATLQDLGVEVLYAPTGLAQWLAAYGRHLTAVWTARPDVSASLLDLIRATTDARILYYLHDLHYVREMRRYQVEGNLWALAESNRLKKLELTIFRKVDCIMTPSAEEVKVLDREVPGAQVRLIPPYLYPSPTSVGPTRDAFAARRDVLFVGGFKHAPNVDAALRLARDIMPLVWAEAPDARLMLVGDSPTEEVSALAGERVEVTGYVPDLAPYFGRARVSVSPLRYGAGVKGKIVGSLEAGIPVVTTAVGNEGIALADGVEVLLGETPDALAAAVLRLLHDPDLCSAMSAAGLDVIRRRFSEDGAREVMLQVLGMDMCRVCGKMSFGKSNFTDSQRGNWSELFACSACYALNRTEALADVLLAPHRGSGANCLRAAIPYMSHMRIHEFGFVGPVAEQLRACLLFTCSEYFDDVPPGDFADNGVMCQDLQNLTFRDDEFDLLISQDVFEHVPDAERAFRETHRVLKQGGRHVFTVPFNRHAETTVVRAELTAEGIRHLLPPEYHGDPLRKEGALAFRTFGRDLIPLLDRLGFHVTLHERLIPDVPGGYVAVFSAMKR